MRAFALLLIATAIPALADDAGLLKCRAIKDSAARLACYDALPMAATSPAGTTPQARPAPAATPQQFGFEHKQEILQVDAIDSSIPGRFEGWRGNVAIALANGQVWQVTDDSRATLDLQNPKARIRRGALGAFYMEIEGTNRSPRVKRVK